MINSDASDVLTLTARRFQSDPCQPGQEQNTRTDPKNITGEDAVPHGFLRIPVDQETLTAAVSLSFVADR